MLVVNNLSGAGGLNLTFTNASPSAATMQGPPVLYLKLGTTPGILWNGVTLP